MQTLQFTAAFLAGLFVGILNTWFWAKQTPALLAGKITAGQFTGRAVLKMSLIGLFLWLILKEGLDPIGFVAGLSMAVLGTLIQGFLWKK